MLSNNNNNTSVKLRKEFQYWGDGCVCVSEIAKEKGWRPSFRLKIFWKEKNIKCFRRKPKK